jgi:nickel-dependent lactate racemase
MMLFAKGAASMTLSAQDIREGLLSALRALGPRSKVLLLPPDITRAHSRAGELTEAAWQHYGASVSDILPALGTHVPMTPAELNTMFGATPHNLFRIHDWRNDVVTLGTVPADYVSQVSKGAYNQPWPAQVNKLLAEGGHDLILSIGQVVPHEVIGMANYTKNVFVGTGGPEGINKSHFLGAVYGMERIMGRADTPVRSVIDYAAEHFAAHLPIVYVLTVLSRDSSGKLVVRGLFIGDDRECYERAAALAIETNITFVPQPLKKVVVNLDPHEYKSTWLGNKSIYRTRMAIADAGELLVLAPGVKEFGEDKEIDRLIRKYGYKGTPTTMAAVEVHAELSNNLSAAAHLVHGSSEGRFSITYCPGHLSREEIEGVGYRYAQLDQMLARYNPALLKEGLNVLADGEEIFYISNPAVGLWAHRQRFDAAS